MIYTIPSNWTVEKKGLMPGKELSSGDKDTILKLYRA
jgi:hypothetical protein